ncbi:MAG: hypothetical protein LBU41_05900 [Clostridiales Family XIII bacterium]|jgi:hypothetical protein|nr:hypothetical protein [Clostridiales Family XIII bacterium]
MYKYVPDSYSDEKAETLAAYEASNCILCGSNCSKFRYRGKMVCENCMGIIKGVY